MQSLGGLPREQPYLEPQGESAELRIVSDCGKDRSQGDSVPAFPIFRNQEQIIRVTRGRSALSRIPANLSASFPWTLRVSFLPLSHGFTVPPFQDGLEKHCSRTAWDTVWGRDLSRLYCLKAP
jgi:hypothetical protein